ncbi:type I secretion C-terminal target domain-containing protein, partial [Acinetobacter junii]|uniref:type I secretion C-terminal target domain-containing protein n=1 Tax=Acinetobacter junii TaxID=40215 RepID=UPI003A8A1F6E
ILDGSAGDDVLDGGLSADTLLGGLGSDVYYIDNINDIIVEKYNEGNDKLYTKVSYSLTGRHIEEVYLEGEGDIIAKGNSLNNTLIGNAGNNLVDGGLGRDTVIFHIIDNTSNNAGNGLDTWSDFTIGNIQLNSNADKIDISSLLIGYTSDQFIGDFLNLYSQNGNTTLSIDRDGAQNTYNSENILILSKVNVDLSTLLENQQLII